MVTSFFDDDDKSVEASVDDFPSPLAGGVVLDQRYAISAKALSSLICKPSSSFFQELLTVQKTTEYSEEPWKSVKNDSIERVVSYMKAATKIIKSVKATETHTCRRLDDRGFVLDISCATPDVPCGTSFLVELQVCSYNYFNARYVIAQKVAYLVFFSLRVSAFYTSIRN